MTFVEHGNQTDNVKHVMEVMQLFQEFVSKIQIFSDQLLTVSAPYGKIEYVLNVLKELSSIPMEFADKFLIIVPLGII